MARPRKHRKLCSLPDVKQFNDCNSQGDAIIMTDDEYETLRLIDYLGLTQQECARQMQVARTSITATYDRARYKLADSVINQKKVVVTGGEFVLCKNSASCCGQCGKSRCSRCKHGSCDMCIGIYHKPGRECYTL